MDQPGITCISRRSFIAGSALAFASLGFGLYGCAEPADNGAAHVNRGKAPKGPTSTSRTGPSRR